MAEEQYAFIKNDIVTNLVLFDNPSEELLNHFKEFHDVDMILKSSIFATINGTYDGLKFWPPQPYPSWIKNEELNEWEAPTPYPEFNAEDPKNYIWNEDILNWEEVSE